MNHDATPDTAPDALRWQLRALRRDIPPGRDLWPGIGDRLAGLAREAAPPAPVPRRRPSAPWAMAAALALAVGLGWQLRPAGGDGAAPVAAEPATPALTGVAAAMSREYEAALRTLDRAYGPVEDGGVLAQLDASAAVVAAALEQDPDARFLLQRLQRIHAHRLALVQRLARA